MFRKDRKNEYYTQKAHEEGYPARSVYKLKEIDEKYHVFKHRDYVLDLGCAPGSWLIYIARRIGNQGKVVGIDIQDIKINKSKNIFFKKIDLMALSLDGLKLISRQSGVTDKYQVVVSDLSPKTCGIRSVDAYNSFKLTSQALNLALGVLAPQGNFVSKIFESEKVKDIFNRVKSNFSTARLFRPKAVLKHSREVYIIGINYLGNYKQNDN